jgi:hypothetical protein
MHRPTLTVACVQLANSPQRALRAHRACRPISLLWATTLLSWLTGCVYLPRTTEVYDPDCRIMSRHLDLQPVQVAAIGGCRNNECAVLLVAAGATAAASAVVSGSIVIVGNVAYWFEKQGRCIKGGPAEATSEPVPLRP